MCKRERERERERERKREREKGEGWKKGESGEVKDGAVLGREGCGGSCGESR